MTITKMYKIRVVFVLVALQIALIVCLNITEPIASRMGPNGPSFAPPMKVPAMYANRYVPLKHMPFDPLFMAPQIMANAVVPMAVSFSVGYLLFKLIALGFFMLEKELAFTFGHMKMDNKIDSVQLGKMALSQSTLLPILERIHKAIDKYANMNKQP